MYYTAYMSVYEFILFLNVLFIATLIFEMLYTFYKKDGVYEPVETINNLLGGVFLLLEERFFNGYYKNGLENIAGNVSQTSNSSIFSFLACLLLVDFFYYIFHFSHHKISVLWSMHKVHHSGRRFNLSTAYRISWLEHIYFLLFFIPLLLVGFKLSTILLSLYILGIHQGFCHSSYIKFPKWLEYFIVTPQSHTLHHDIESENHNKNFGGIFSLWDHLFKTQKNSTKKITFGVKGVHGDFFLKVQLRPLLEWLHLFKKIKILEKI